MRRRGWWIFGGVVLLWLSPVFWGVSSFLYRKHQKADYDRRAEAFRVKLEEKLKVTITDEDRARWKERERLEKIAEEAERDRKRNEYLASPIQPHMKPSSITVLDDDEEKPVRVVYIQSKPDPYDARLDEGWPFNRKPNLSGVYFSYPIQGPNQNQVQLNYVQGPF